MIDEIKPLPDPPDHCEERRVIMTVGSQRDGQRFEFRYIAEIRKLPPLKAEVIEMPDN